MCFTFFELNWKKNTLNVSPSEWFLDVPDTGCTFIWDQIRTAMVLKVNSINRKQRHHFPLLSKRKILSNCHLILSNFIPTKSDATRQRMCISLPETSIPLNWLEKEPLCQKLSQTFWFSDQIICLSHGSHLVGLVKASQYHQFNHYFAIWYAVHKFWYP